MAVCSATRNIRAMPVVGYLADEPGFARLNAAFQRVWLNLTTWKAKTSRPSSGSAGGRCLKRRPIWFASM